MTTKELVPIVLSLIAGSATVIGAAFAIAFEKENQKRLIISLGFAAGVMFTLSFFELLPESIELIQAQMYRTMGLLMVGMSFFLGMLIASLVEKTMEEKTSDQVSDKALYKVGLSTTFAMVLHNFPEGVITFIAGYQDIRLGIAVALGIILHNIPEGVAIGAPIYYATKSRKKAIFYSLISGLSEPFAAFCTLLFFKAFITDLVLAISLGFVAGIMVQIAIYELLKTALKRGEKKTVFTSFTLGVVLMAVVLVVL